MRLLHLYTLMNISYVNSPHVLFFFVEALERLDSTNTVSLVKDAYFIHNLSYNYIDASIIRIVCKFLKLHFEINAALRHSFFRYVDISHADVCAQALSEVFNICLIVDYYVFLFNNMYNVYNANYNGY
jgi:hypothetical protein